METKKLCIKCKKRPILVKKVDLCSTCYQRNRKNLIGGSVRTQGTLAKIEHGSEMEFVRNYFQHKNWLYHPAMFRLGLYSYTPDFYDGERNVFIEVVGTRQAFYANQKKYIKFIQTFPKINFEVRGVDGEIIDPKAGKYKWSERYTNGKYKKFA